MTPEIEQLRADWPMGDALNLPQGYKAVIAGMYKGRVAELLHELYGPADRLVGFDPQIWALAEAEKRMTRLGAKWELYSFAIGTDYIRNAELGEVETDGCSLLNAGSRIAGIAQVREIGTTLEDFDIWTPQNGVYNNADRFDLCLFNMEGYEFPLLNHMFNETETYYDSSRGTLLYAFKRYAIQFHPWLKPQDAPDYNVIKERFKDHGFEIQIEDYPRWVLWTQNA